MDNTSVYCRERPQNNLSAGRLEDGTGEKERIGKLVLNLYLIYGYRQEGDFNGVFMDGKHMCRAAVLKEREMLVFAFMLSFLIVVMQRDEISQT